MVECDIILLVWNNIEYTKPAIESIFKHTDVPSRLIIVDNGSESPTKEYLKTIRPERTISEVLLLRAEENEGYPKGMNRGLKEADAPYVCLLNNDILATEGWLSEMLKVAKGKPDIGILNPSSNSTGMPLPKAKTLESYAKDLKVYSGKWIEMAWCVGFCMLIKQELIKRIGYLDEIFSIGYFEDQDYSRRASSAGYICAMAKASYIWHAEGASTKRLNREREKLFKKNAKIFHNRWGKSKRIAYVISRHYNGNFDAVKKDMLKFAKENNWVTIFKKRTLNGVSVPEHSNIALVELPDRFFLINVIFKIAKKKKRFDRVIWL